MFDALRHGPARPVMIDSSFFVAYFHQRDQNHEVATSFFEGIQDGGIRARPLYTSEYVVDETATTLLARAGHDRATTAIGFVDASSQLRVLHVDHDRYAETLEQFSEYDDQTASFTDHAIAIQADRNDVDTVLSFDGDFETFGLRTLPENA